MNITQELTLDLTRREDSTPILDLVQGDTVRRIRLKLLRDGEPWPIPEDAIVVLRYLKPDGTGGAYDTLDDGLRAWSVQDNAVLLTVAPQVCTASGMVQLQVSIHKEKQQLSTFSFLLRADKEINGEGESGEYANLAAWIEKHGRGERGEPGVSPVVEVSDIPDGHRVTFTDVNGVSCFDVPNSQIPTAHLLRIAALEEKAFSALSGTGSVSFSARAGSGITFVGKMKAVQSGEGDPTPDNIRPIAVTETVSVSVMDVDGTVQQSHIVVLPAACGKGYIDWARRKYVQTHGVYVLNGTEGFYHWLKNNFRWDNPVVAEATRYDEVFDGVCSHYKPATHGTLYVAAVDLAVSWLLGNPTYPVHAIVIRDARFETADEFKAYLAEQYAAGTPVTVVYKLANPVEYDLGVLPTLTAQEGITLFACDTNDGFTVQYNHDELAVANWEALRDRADYVIAEGVSGDWTYRKWSSGIAECWGKNAFSGAVTTAYGNTYYNSTAKNVAFPFTFLEVPHLVVNVVATDAQIYTSHIIVCNKTLFNYYICSDKQQTNAKLLVHAYAVGRWK